MGVGSVRGSAAGSTSGPCAGPGSCAHSSAGSVSGSGPNSRTGPVSGLSSGRTSPFSREDLLCGSAEKVSDFPMDGAGWLHLQALPASSSPLPTAITAEGLLPLEILRGVPALTSRLPACTSLPLGAALSSLFADTHPPVPPPLLVALWSTLLPGNDKCEAQGAASPMCSFCSAAPSSLAGATPLMLEHRFIGHVCTDPPSMGLSAPPRTCSPPARDCRPSSFAPAKLLRPGSAGEIPVSRFLYDGCAASGSTARVWLRDLKLSASTGDADWIDCRRGRSRSGGGRIGSPCGDLGP